MKKTTKKNTVEANDFEKLIKTFSGKHSLGDVWSDWTTMFAISLSQTYDYREEREKRYLSIAEKYSKDELEKFCELSALLTLELENNPEQDFLGETFMNLGLGDRYNGQFFTPYHVGELMAICTCGNPCEQIRQNGYITINDSSCGSGVMLISSFHAIRTMLSRENPALNAQNHVLAAAQDINETAAMMCYIQLSLLGIAAVIKVGNSLTDPMTNNLLDMPRSPDLWFTPMYNFPVWHDRRLIHGVMTLLDSPASKKNENSEKLDIT